MMMLGAKVPNYDAYGLLRTMCSHTPTQYSHIGGLKSHFYAHIGGGSQTLSPTYEQAHVGLDLLTLASYDVMSDTKYSYTANFIGKYY